MGGATDKRLFYIPTYMVKQVNLAPMQEESSVPDKPEPP